MESEVEKKLWKVCKAVNKYEGAAEKSMMLTTNIYNSNRRVIANRHMQEMKFVEHADRLSRNLTSLQKRSSRLSQKIWELHINAQKQMEDLYRTEVDIDIKLRACLGSCQSAVAFTVNHPSYQSLQTDMDQINKTLNQIRKAAVPPKGLPHIKLQPADVGPAPYAAYKTIGTAQRELLVQVEDIRQNQLVLEELLEDAEVLNLAELD
ncbi:fibrinogen alpha chain [Anabas testudineus]|nr:fibrinogen alpha chain [Anabas testudineus]